MIMLVRDFPNIELGLTPGRKKANECLDEVACFLGNLVGKSVIAVMAGEIEWNHSAHNHP